MVPLTPHHCCNSPPITTSPPRPPRPRSRPRQATPRTLPIASNASPPRLRRAIHYGAPFPCRRTSHAPPMPRPPTTSGPRSQRRTSAPMPSRTAAAHGSLEATPRPMIHLRPRTRSPATLPAQATGVHFSFSLHLSPPPTLTPALSPAPTPHRPPISRDLRIPLRPPHRLPPHPARRSRFIPASPRILPLAILLQQTTPAAAPPLRPPLPALRPPPRHLAVDPLHLWHRAPGWRLRRTASAREHAVASLGPPHPTHA